MSLSSIIRPTAALVSSVVFALSYQTAGAASDSFLDPEAWPRVYEVKGGEVAIYMPQILEWPDFRHMKGTSAVGVKLEGREEVSFGAVMIDADTVADFDRGTVQFGKRSFTGLRFPELDEKASDRAEKMVRGVLTPEAPMELPLAAVTAAMERDGVSLKETEVSFDPPPIFYSSSPAVLLTFVGEPRLEPVKADDASLMFAVNTNWDVLAEGGRFYLLADGQWLVADDAMKGPWTPAKSLPASFKNLPDDSNWSDVKASLEAPLDDSHAPRVIASNRPAEIIVTNGRPQMVPIAGTSLMYVANTESDLFLQPASNLYYLLTAGRWFSARSLEGPWGSAMDDLPEDFAKIPESHPKGHVLVSVRGTPAADEAVIQASIPQTATVDRATASVEVSYEGEPQFKTVNGASAVQYAVNTSNDVFLVAGNYYCCHQGVWFQAPAATGRWVVCDLVPQVIYTIPSSSPKHHVTYVYVYDSTPQVVHVGVTSGYSGAYVARGLLVFGLGMWLGHELAEDHWHHHYYPRPCWYGYGCGAVYYHGHGYCRRPVHYYGPYGGAGYGAVYHPATGIYTRSAYAYGPRGAVVARSAYNPWTDTAAGRVTVKTPYGSWGHSAVVRDDEWIRAAHHSNFSRTVGGVQTSRGGSVVGINRRFGSDAFVAKTAGGDVYVGKDGNIYKRDAEDGWQKRHDGGWVHEPSVPDSPHRPSVPEVPGAGPRPDTKPSGRPSNLPVNAKGGPAGDKKGPGPEPRTGPGRAEPPVKKSPSQPRQASGGRVQPGYKSTQPTATKLSRDSYSRDRAGSPRSAGTRSKGSSSKSKPAARGTRR